MRTPLDVSITRDGITRGEVSCGGITRGEVSRDGITRAEITRDGITRDGITRDGITRDGITRDGITRDGITRHRVRRSLCLSLLLLLACGDDDAPRDATIDVATEDAAIDANPDAADGSVAIEPASPEAPIWACATGWSEITIAGARACELPAATRDCGPGRAHFVGGAGCEDVGAACPSVGDFADGVSDDAIFVRPDADGVGTRASPFGTIDDALAIAGDGDVIALSVGEHLAAAQLRGGVRLVGACAASTRLLRIPGTDFVLGLGSGRSATIEGLSIEGAEIAIGVGGEATIRGVVIESTVGAGIAVTSTGRAILDEVVVRGVRPAGTSGGMALFVDGGTVEGSRVILEDAVRSALRVTGGRVTLDDVRADALPFGTLSRGAGTWVTGGEVTLRRVDLRGATNNAAEVATGGVLRLSDVLATELQEVDPPGNFALYAQDGGTLEIDRALVRGPGWLVHVDDGTLALRDALLEGEAGGGTLYADHVGVVSFASPLSIERVVIVDTDSGVLTLGPFDFSIDPDPPSPPPEPPPPDPIAFAIDDLQLVGVGRHARFGYGVSLDVPFVGRVARVSSEALKGITLDVSGDVALEDARVIAPVAAGDADGAPSFANALVVRGGSSTLARARFEDSFEIAIDVRGAALDLRDVVVLRAQERPCAVDVCRDAPGGVGLGAYFDATVRAENLVIDGADLCGVQLAFDATIDLVGGVIRGATVGACVQVDGYDVRRVASGVRYEDNGTNVETTTHAVPEPPPPPSL